MAPEHHKILVGAIIVLALGEGVLLFKAFSPTTSYSTPQVVDSNPQGQSTQPPVTTQPGEKIIGIAGTITAVTSTSATIDIGNSQKMTIVLTGDTKFFNQGAAKSHDTIQKEFDQFNAMYQELAKDSANIEKIKMLIPPSTFNQTSITQADMHVGDSVQILTYQDKNGASSALQVTKTPPATR